MKIEDTAEVALTGRLEIPLRNRGLTVKVSAPGEALSGEVLVPSAVLVLEAVHVCRVSVARAVGNDLAVKVSVEDRVEEAVEAEEEVEAAGRDKIVPVLNQATQS